VSQGLWLWIGLEVLVNIGVGVGSMLLRVSHRGHTLLSKSLGHQHWDCTSLGRSCAVAPHVRVRVRLEAAGMCPCRGTDLCGPAFAEVGRSIAALPHRGGVFSGP
jgi:hypothetical protein